MKRGDEREERAAGPRDGSGGMAPSHSGPSHGWTRRQFLAQAAATFALSGIAVCSRQPIEEIVPYVKQPPGLVPGRSLHFASSSLFRGYARGVLVESHEGRPTRMEGNVDHPSSLGGADVFTQASILDLYDPDRSQVILHVGEVTPWPVFFQALEAEMEPFRRNGGRGLRLLTGNFTSPTLLDQVRALLRQLPRAHWHVHDPVQVSPPATPGTGAARLQTLLRFDRADVILALDSDFLYDEPGSLRHAREFADGRRVRAGRAEMNRLYVAEPLPTVTGSNADHRLPLQASAMEALARGVALRLGIPDSTGGPGPTSPGHQNWIEAVADDLKAHRGRGLIVAGASQPPSVHLLAREMNRFLGNEGESVVYLEPVEAALQSEAEPIEALVAAMSSDQVEMLAVLDCNPVYDAGVDLDFARAMDRVRLRLHHGLYNDETARLCHWHLPATHELEMWSDARGHDGTAGLIQPLIAPLYEGRPHHEVLAALLGLSGVTSYQIVRSYWREHWGGPQDGDFEEFWRRALRDGFVPRTAAMPLSSAGTEAPPHPSAQGSPASRPLGDEVSGSAVAPMRAESDPAAAAPPTPSAPIPAAAAPPTGPADLELVFKPDPSVWDGRYANNSWLQELPRPVTKLTWDNAALVNPSTAARLRLRNMDVVEIRAQGRSVEAPIWILPGVADASVVVHLGYGRREAGQTAQGAGFDAYRLRSSAAPWFGSGCELKPTGRTYQLATTQGQQQIEGRDMLRHGSLESFRRSPSAVLGDYQGTPPASLYPPVAYDGYKWGMNIDLTACIGCNACTIACQAENNIPSVGKTQVLADRVMHWIRVDSYIEGDPDRPAFRHQPVPCMHCEDAPCELVCPTGATVHSSEGLNEMIYNRCVGTRYCSNNCPYKVRRFNFFDFTSGRPDSLKLERNPNVTVRSRGVMEKCTYCVQRIETARIEAMKTDRLIGADEVVTACQSACPTRAITFGDLNRPESEVSRLTREPHNYAMLAELNTRPRTTYLAHLRNPNPQIEEI